MKSTTRLQPLPTLDKPKETNMSSTNIYIPYTYLLFHKKSRTFYYGSRTAKNCHPSDLFESYFSSSNVIKSIIKKEGKDAFLFRVDQTFETAKETLEYEYQVLKRYEAGTNERFLNKHHTKSVEWTPESKAKASETHKRKVREGTHPTAFKKGHSGTKGFTGGKHTDQQKLIWSEERSGDKNVSCRPEVREKRRQQLLKNNPAKDPEIQKKMKASAKKRAPVTCPHCNKTGKVPGMYFYHFDRCKFNSDPAPKMDCLPKSQLQNLD